MPAKKNFKTSNPALSFISPGADTAAIHTDSYVYEHNYTHTDISYPNASSADTEDKSSSPINVYTHTHSRRENKSRRLQLLIKPSVHAGISGIARKNDTSVNDTINTILEEYLRKGEF